MQEPDQSLPAQARRLASKYDERQENHAAALLRSLADEIDATHTDNPRTAPPEPFKEDAAHYLATHGDVLKLALESCERLAAPEDRASGIDDKSYWRHELRALQQALDRLSLAE